MKDFAELAEEAACNVLANFPEVSKAEAAHVLASYRTGCEEVLGRLLQGEIAKLIQALRGVALALAPRDEGKAIAARESIYNRAERAGWISKETDFAMGAPLAPGESLVSFTFDRVKTSTGRELLRGQLRAANRPPSWSNDLTWESQFPKIEPKEQQA